MACKPQTEDSTCCPGGMGSRALLRKASQQRTREVCCHALSKRRPSWSVHPFVHLAYHLRVTVGSPRSMQQRDQADTGRVVTNDHRSVILHTAYYGSRSECALFTGTLLTQHGLPELENKKFPTPTDRKTLVVFPDPTEGGGRW
jgi:hypothetical protein